MRLELILKAQMLFGKPHKKKLVNVFNLKVKLFYLLFP